MIQRAPFNALIPVLILTFLLLGTVPVQGTCACGHSTADHGKHPRGTWDAYPQPHSCCNGGKVPQFDFNRCCTLDALPYIRAVVPRVQGPLQAAPSALSAESPLFPSIVSSLSGKGLTHPEEVSGPPDLRSLPLRC